MFGFAELELDLLIAFAAIALLCFFAFYAGRAVSKLEFSGKRKSLFLLGGSIFLALVFSWQFQARLSWAVAIPLAAVVLWSNFTAPILAFAAGVAVNTASLKRSRIAVTGSLAILSLLFLVAPLARPLISPPTIAEGGRFSGQVCLQSHESTCAPASAATLLRLNGIDATEKELVKACLTCNKGTEALGLYRALKISADRQSQEVNLAARDPQFWLNSGQLPNVALVRFPADEFGPLNSTLCSVKPAYPTIANRSPFRFLGTGQEDGHAVVVVGFENEKWIIADPAIGMVKWSDKELRSRFTGDAIYLTR